MRIDESAGLVRCGYLWASRLRGGRPAVPVRFLGRESVLVGGPDGVRRFYDPLLRRRGAVPPPVSDVLFGHGSIHGLDGAEHHHQKAMFLDVLAPAAVARLRDGAREQWREATRTWEAGRPVVLFDQAVHVLTATALPWAGVPAEPAGTGRRAGQLAALLDGFASPGPRYARAVLARRSLERWATRLIRAARAHEVHPRPGTALAAVVHAHDTHGQLLPERAAAVALLNVVRPMVAVAWFIAFAGIALHHQPFWRDLIAAGDPTARAAFAHEVRRRYPFVPVLAARAPTAQDVLGVGVPDGGYVILDVHGTDHDPRRWPEPDRFDPGRFLAPPADPDSLVPQGGGDVATGHRCPGETVTLAMIEQAVEHLATTGYDLPAQDLRVDLTRIPARPRSGVVITPAG
ncbi:cytochrome P450 [Jiangella gansuensis]|uniref:cytochrome P450 n=1 Tax=Jiangella gansuensis TaxID=281473 RepID=UPI000564361C|nr:cytochrome P450 [Jiangella gansuensis]